MISIGLDTPAINVWKNGIGFKSSAFDHVQKSSQTGLS